MALDRTFSLWLTRQVAPGSPGVVRQALDPSTTWVGSTPEHVAAKVRAHVQAGLWDGAGAPVTDQLPAVNVEVAPSLVVNLPARRDGMPRLAVEVAVVVVSAGRSASGPGAVLAVAPALGLSWSGATAAEAVDGLREATRLDLLARDPPMDGAALASLAANAARVTDVEAVPIPLSFPTFQEIREHKRKGEAKAGDFLSPVRPGKAWHVDAELTALERVIRSGRSVVLVGPRGVGKSALVGELVASRWAECTQRAGQPVRLLEAHAPTFLVRLLADGSWQDALARLCTRLGESGDWLYVTSLPELFEVGRYEGNNTSCGEFVRPWLGRGELRLVSECTSEELAAIDARYPGALNGVVRLPVPEPTDRLEAILDAWNHATGGAFTPGALRDALRLHRRFAPSSGLPGRILRFLDAVRLERSAGGGVAESLDRDVVYGDFCSQTGLLRALIDPRFPLPYAQITGFFEQRVYGQPAANRAVAAAIASVKADVSPWGKPLASMLLVGPTGVGKTEMARALADFLFGSDGAGAERMIRFDMSEFQTPGSVLRLIEGPEGEGLLTSAVRRQPFCVLLLDELEKAHPAVLDLLLQVLGEGRLTDGRGRLTDFCACVVLMTSNVGAVDAKRNAAGFGGPDGDDAAARARLDEKAARYRDAVKAWLRPELLNRIDHILPFDPLGPETIGRVLDRELAALARRPGLQHVPLTVSPGAREALSRAGYDPAWGARQLQRAVQEQLVSPMARGLFDGRGGRASVAVDAAPGGLDVQVARDETRLAPRLYDRLYDRVVALRARCRHVVEGPSFAELEARLEQASRKGAARQGYAARAAVAATTSLLRLLETVLRVEQDLGVVALLDLPRAETGSDPPADVVEQIRAIGALERELVDLSLRLAAETIPDIGHLVLGVFGDPDSAPFRELVGVYTRVAERCGCTVEGAKVLPALGKSGGFCSVFPGRIVGPKPDPKAPAVGVELVIAGPAAALLFRSEAGVHAFAPGFVGPAGLGPPLQKEVRISIVASPTTHPKYLETRPDDLNRKLRFEGQPDRTIAADRVQGIRTRFRLPSFAELEPVLQRWFEQRLYEDVTR